jgi:hypothetical protein
VEDVDLIAAGAGNWLIVWIVDLFWKTELCILLLPQVYIHVYKCIYMKEQE